jgi:two-component system OmpR family sensor kinase
MIRTIHGKLTAIMLAFLLLMGFLFIVLTVFSSRIYFQETSQRLNTSIAKRLVSTRTFFVNGEIDQVKLAGIFYELMDVNPNMDVYLVDNSGLILSSSVATDRIKRRRIDMEPVNRFMSGEDNYPILGDNPVTEGMMEVFSACPIPITGRSEGFLYIVLPGESQRSLLAALTGSHVLSMSTYIAATGMLLIFLAAIFIFHHLTRRLRVLSRKVESFGQSGVIPDELVSEPGIERDGDEIDRLASVFYQMTRTISGQMEKLTQADAMRRELVTNVSHDLRTPLTSLQGYLETLIFKKDLSPAERDEYLRTALTHSDRLRKLVTDLFELSNLEAGQAEIQPELFSFSELAQDILQKYQIPASEKDIELIIELTPDMPFVLGDIGYIERVMENLILNAILYTPPGGKVTVSIHEEEDALRLSVADTGHGISEDDLPHIFDRYFRAMLDHPATDGTGLGLAIARRIAELHGRTIDVQSTLGEGSTFSFSLPVPPPDTPA